MFQNTDFSYTNSYDEEEMIKILGDAIIKEIKENKGYALDLIIAEELFCRGQLLYDKTKDVVNYYIGHYYKFYKTIYEMECEMGWEINPYYLNEDYYDIIAQYLIYKRINNSGIFNYIF